MTDEQYRDYSWNRYTRQAPELLRPDGSMPCEVCDGPMTRNNMTETRWGYHCGCAEDHGGSDHSERMAERKAMGLRA